MNVLVVLAHPDPDSLNHAIAEIVRKSCQDLGHDVVFHDLYAERFDPILPKTEIPDDGRLPANIRPYCEELQSADAIVIVHPNWWGQPPAILKGWIDRVFRPGVAYRFDEGDTGEGIPVGLLKAKVAVVINTSNTPDEREKSAFGDPLESIWKRCIFDLCGVHTVHRKMFNVVATSTPAQRIAWLTEVRRMVSQAVV